MKQAIPFKNGIANCNMKNYNSAVNRLCCQKIK